MAFFHPRTFYHPTEASSPSPSPSASSSSFTPLFRLLDDFDSYSRQNGKPATNPPRRQQAPQWQPKFDVRETSSAYELHGELPGVAKEAVHIEFSDPQTLVVRGRSERTYTAGTSPVEKSTTPSTGTVTEKQQEASSSSSSRRNSRQATVEDEDEASERESGYEVVTTAQDTNKSEEDKRKRQAVDRAKYWLTERSIGEFSRSFHFPSLVDYEAVSASYQNGILSIVVPKAKKLEARRIVIN
ncbi:HSP20-like chaperone [Trichoderma novae-zelandiae]